MHQRSTHDGATRAQREIQRINFRDCVCSQGDSHKGKAADLYSISAPKKKEAGKTNLWDNISRAIEEVLWGKFIFVRIDANAHTGKRG